ncbi:MAG: 23S rRNA (guanosine(2251)-2'-O)-methyltransferase RlmB [Clostridia bacterium]
MKIEGRNPVYEALTSSVKLDKIYIQKNTHNTQKILDLAKENKIQFVFCDKVVLDRMSETGNHQGVIAEGDEFNYCEIEDILAVAKQKKENAFIVILDGIEDPHNLGSIIRVCECAGVHGVIIPKHRAVSVNETVLKTSAGAVNHIKICKVTNINDAIRSLKDSFINVFCADMEGASAYKTNLTGDLALVIGSEGFGVKPLTKKLCDGAICIEQFGKVNSLNASVACGIVVFEAVRQRKNL